MANIEAFDGYTATKKDGSKIRFLVVDDSKFMLNQMKRFLEAIGGEVVGEALDGTEAVKLYKALKPDLVTLDLTMPKMDGLETLVELKKIDKDAKVIMVSAVGNEHNVKEAILRGALYFIVKPLTISKIKENLIPVLKKVFG